MPDGRPKKFFVAAFLVAVIFLSFLAGSAATFFEFFPSAYFTDGFRALRALYVQSIAYRDPINSNLWNRALESSTGVTHHDQGKSYGGFTLYTSGHGPVAILVSMDGNIVHQWELDFMKAWPEPRHRQYVADNKFMLWRKVRLFGNGDLLAIYCGEGVTPNGHGLIKIDKESRLIWKYPEAVHHDVDIGEDGRIYTLISDIRAKPLPQAPRLKPPILDDSIVILSPDGVELDRINVIQAFLDSPHYRSVLASIPDNRLGDYLHTNSVDVVTDDLAAAHPYAAAGQILFSMREISTIALLDPESRSIVWAMRGPWVKQHDPDMLSNGNLLIFDNRGHYPNINGLSRVIEFNPTNNEIKWVYQGTKEAHFLSPIRSGQQRLPNGNTLITESGQGHIFEVTRDNEIVWEYRNPARAGDDNQYVAVIPQSERISLSSLDFLH